jgi:hypothetical protein
MCEKYGTSNDCGRSRVDDGKSEVVPAHKVRFWRVAVSTGPGDQTALLPRRVDLAAQNPFRRYLCNDLNLRTHKFGLSAARKQEKTPKSTIQ